MSNRKKQKKQKDCLGRYLIKDRFKQKSDNFKNSSRHTTELQDGQNYNRINFKSITEQTDVDDFLTTAELAETDFTAERLNAKIIIPTATQGIISEEEKMKIKALQEKNKEHLRIPRRPPWDRSMDAEELDASEKESFLNWRRTLALLQEEEGIILTPYEKNLEFWRQLWRVIERSDVVVQIVDARNPLLFLCDDLSKYVKEVDVNKENLLLVNKADFLTQKQREEWASYFKESNIEAIFFSATTSSLDDIEEEELNESFDERNEEFSNKNLPEGEQERSMNSFVGKEEGCSLKTLSINDNSGTKQDNFDVLRNSFSEERNSSTEQERSLNSDFIHANYINCSKILSRKELIEVFTNYHNGPKLHHQYVTIGLAGYPNVGKSSTINALLQEKKVSVSATPGKTKHFQTLFLSNEVLLCDCPGLVFPAFVSTREELIISGILPVDDMRNHVPPMNLLLSLFPRSILEHTYGVRIPPPGELDDKERSPTSEEFLTVYGYKKGFMTQRGIPDHPHCARFILKDYVNGKLLFCHSPPDVNQEEFHEFIVEKEKRIPSHNTPEEVSAISSLPKQQILNNIFQNNTNVGSRISKKDRRINNKGNANPDKPWLHVLKEKRNKRQKLRKKYSYLDE